MIMTFSSGGRPAGASRRFSWVSPGPAALRPPVPPRPAPVWPPELLGPRPHGAVRTSRSSHSRRAPAACSTGSTRSTALRRRNMVQASGFFGKLFRRYLGTSQYGGGFFFGGSFFLGGSFYG